MFPAVWRWWRRASAADARLACRGTAKRPRPALGLERLEDRHAPAVFANTTPIVLPNNVPVANPYPSTIDVAGLVGPISRLSVTLHNVTHNQPGALDALLVGPGGQAFILLADAGGETFSPIDNVTLRLEDAAALVLDPNAPWGTPNSTVISRPVNHASPGDNDNWPPPAPPPPYANPGPQAGGTATLGSVFGGTDPNGTWRLFVAIDRPGASIGIINGGWSLEIITPPDLALAKQTDDITVNPGDKITYALTARNLGTRPATGVVVTETLPAQTAFDPGGSTPGWVETPVGSGVFQFVIGNLGPGDTVALNFAVVVNAAATATQIVNTASIADDGASGADFNAGNNNATVTTAVVAAKEQWVRRVYQDLFRREPLADEAAKALDILDRPGDPALLRLQIVRGLLRQREYFANVVEDTWRTLVGTAMTPEVCVRLVNVLDRGGRTQQVQALTLGSPEYFVKTNGTFAGFAATLHQDVLGRPIDAAGAAFLNRLNARGLSRRAIAARLLNTIEAQQRYVAGLVQRFLRRPATAAELDPQPPGFVGQLRRGVPDTRIIAGLLSSAEYFNL
ncbi:MAG: hypothetical protein NZO58_07845 [Gemmataceae bacterium]|nr:hypothetical protein [Gemmataceae bacterium]